MKFKEYAQQAKTLAIYPEDRGKEYVIFGLIDEAGEVSEKADQQASISDLKDEIGDTLWYLANTIEEFNFNSMYEVIEYNRGMHVSEGTVYKEYAKNTLQHASKLAGKMKKVMRDEDGEYTDQKLEDIYLILQSVVKSLIVLIKKTGLTLDECMEGNLDKLFDRKDRGVLKGDGDKR